VEAWLSALTREELLGLIREHAAEDAEFTVRLQTRSAAAGTDFPALREQIAAVFDAEPVGRGRGGWDDWDYYDPSADIAGRLSDAAGAIRTVLENGRAGEAEQAARFALDQLARYDDDLDDDEGELGRAAVEMAEAHAEACWASRPDQQRTSSGPEAAVVVVAGPMARLRPRRRSTRTRCQEVVRRVVEVAQGCAGKRSRLSTRGARIRIRPTDAAQGGSDRRGRRGDHGQLAVRSVPRSRRGPGASPRVQPHRSRFSGDL
jgi:hypothetical protein